MLAWVRVGVAWRHCARVFLFNALFFGAFATVSAEVEMLFASSLQSRVFCVHAGVASVWPLSVAEREAVDNGSVSCC